MSTVTCACRIPALGKWRRELNAGLGCIGWSCLKTKQNNQKQTSKQKWMANSFKPLVSDICSHEVLFCYLLYDAKHRHTELCLRSNMVIGHEPTLFVRQDQAFNGLVASQSFHLPRSQAFPFHSVLFHYCTGNQTQGLAMLGKTTCPKWRPRTYSYSTQPDYNEHKKRWVTPLFRFRHSTGSFWKYQGHIIPLVVFYNFPQQTIGQRMSPEPNSDLWSIPRGTVSALAASLGTCTHYGGIATGIVTCSGNSGWQLFLLLALFPFPSLESEASEHCRGTDTGLHTDPLSEPNGTFLFERTMPACFLLSSERLYISFLRAIPPSTKFASTFSLSWDTRKATLQPFCTKM